VYVSRLRMLHSVTEVTVSNFSSSIIFLYYQDFTKAIFFFEKILKLDLVMDQGFARVYRAGGDSFLGCVQKREGSIESSNRGGALISLNVDNVDKEYLRFKEFDLPYISDLKIIEQIPLKSFFFKDYEGYDFEIQEFLKKEDKEMF